MLRRKTFYGFVILALGVALSGCMIADLGDGPPLTLATVDRDRMYGGWYMIATMRNSFEKGIVAPYDVYTKRDDGDIREDFYFRNGGFQEPVTHYQVHDWILPGTHNANWRVQIVWPLDLPFLVLYVDPSYRYVMFGERNRQLGWIYARMPTIPNTDYQAMLARFESLGFDRTAFVKFVQTPDQIGQPGFWSEGLK